MVLEYDEKNLDEISRLLYDLFFVRKDVYAEQFRQKNGKKGFRIVKEQITLDLIKEHLQNKKALGSYNLDKNSLVKWGALDFDDNTKEDYDRAIKIYNHAVSKGYHPLLEKSGGGEFKVHLWFFSKEKIPAKDMRVFLNNLCSEVGEVSNEVFPKQDKIGLGEYGNLVKLPLGLHLGTNKQSVISSLEKDFLEVEEIKNKLKIQKEYRDDIYSEPRIETQVSTDVSKTLRIKESPNQFDDFFNTVLNTELPEGDSLQSSGKITGINDNVIKNLAIWLNIKGFTLDRLENEIKPYYDSKKWSFGGLRGWFKKAEKGDIMEISIPELKKWSETYFPEFTKLLPTKEELSKPIATTGLELKTFSDFKKLKKDTNFIVQDFLKPKTVTMLYSPPACFKTLLMTHLGMATATGKPFLKLKTKKTPTLYCNGENSETIYKDYLEGIHSGMGIKRNKFPFYVLSNGILMDSKKNVNLKFIVELEREIKEKKIKLVIFDTMHRFAFYDENRADDINLLYTQIFKPLIEEYGVSILFLHHSTKGGDYRGSGDFLGMVDVCYKVTRKFKTNDFKIVNEKARGGEISDINGEIDFTEDYIKFIRKSTVEETEKTVSKLKEVTEKLKDIFIPGRELKRKELIEELDLKEIDYGSVKTLNRTLKFLVDNDYLVKTEKGVYTQRLE